jgi:hypothetical protein
MTPTKAANVKHDILLIVITALVVLFTAGLVKPIPEAGPVIIPP